jgi:hypothetical protein
MAVSVGGLSSEGTTSTAFVEDVVPSVPKPDLPYWLQSKDALERYIKGEMDWLVDVIVSSDDSVFDRRDDSVAKVTKVQVGLKDKIFNSLVSFFFLLKNEYSEEICYKKMMPAKNQVAKRYRSEKSKDLIGTKRESLPKDIEYHTYKTYDKKLDIKIGICRGISLTFAELYLKTLKTFPVEDHLKKVANLFKDGAPEVAGIKQPFARLKTDLFDKRIIYLSDFDFHFEESVEILKKMNDGVYEIIFNRHSIALIKEKNILYVFDSNYGLLKFDGSNRGKHFLDFLMTYEGDNRLVIRHCFLDEKVALTHKFITKIHKSEKLNVFRKLSSKYVDYIPELLMLYGLYNSEVIKFFTINDIRKPTNLLVG